MSGSSRRPMWVRELAIIAGYTVLALLLTFPLGFRIRRHVVQPAEDPLLNSWILSWDVHAILEEPEHLFQGNIFYPYPDALAYSEHLLAPAVLAMPLQLLFVNPIAVYGIMSLLTFVLSAYGGYLLGRHVSGSVMAGLLAGLIFAFCPYRFGQMHHLQNLNGQWFPFVFLFLIRTVRRGRWTDRILLILFVVLQALSSVYYALFMAVALLLIAPFLVICQYWRQWSLMVQTALRLLATGLVAGALVGPSFLPYKRVADVLGAGRSLSYVTRLSPDLLSYLAAPAGNWLYGTLSSDFRKEPEGSLFPGAMAMGLAILGTFAGLRSPLRERRIVGGMMLVLTLAAGALSLGPTIHVCGQPLLRGPYILLWRFVPGFSGVRVPGRFAVLVMLGIAMLASLGALRIAHMRPLRRQWWAILAIGVFVIVEYLSVPLPFQYVAIAAHRQAAYQWLKEQPSSFAVVELPIDEYPAFDHNIQYVMASTLHWKRIVNGYSGVFPQGYLALTSELQRFPDQSAIDALRRLGVRYVLVHWEDMEVEDLPDENILFYREKQGITWVGTFGTTWIYRLEPLPEQHSRMALGDAAWQVFLLRGWSAMETSLEGRPARWMEGPVATLLWPVEEQSLRDFRLSLFGEMNGESCRLDIDGLPMGSWSLQSGWVDLKFRLSHLLHEGMHLVRLECLGVTWPERPLAVGILEAMP